MSNKANRTNLAKYEMVTELEVGRRLYDENFGVASSICNSDEVCRLGTSEWTSTSCELVLTSTNDGIRSVSSGREGERTIVSALSTMIGNVIQSVIRTFSPEV